MKKVKHNGVVYKGYRFFLTLLLFLAMLTLACCVYYYCDKKIPKYINIIAGKEETIDLKLPVEAEINVKDSDAEGIEVWQLDTKKLPADKIRVTFNEPVTLRAADTGSYTISLKLFGIITLREIPLQVIEEESVIACGMPIGIIMETDGILVLGTGTVSGEDGLKYENAFGVVESGDYITAIDGKKLNNKEELIEHVQVSNGNPVVLTVRRGNTYFDTELKPVKSSDESYKLGIWIRDDTQGIGTLTYITSTGDFGALGHGITDVDTGILMEVAGGSIYEAKVASIVKGKAGNPGELSGYIYSTNTHFIGKIDKNTSDGVFGSVIISEDVLEKVSDSEHLETVNIGLRQDIVTGPAKIICYLDGNYHEYSINIDAVNLGDTGNKGIVFTVTDEELISMTGGIVQGMSGSPIIQNGRLIGAVTHVFVSDSKRGYGTFIENMLRY